MLASRPDWSFVLDELVVEIEEEPWSVYDEYCLRCSSRAIVAAPIRAEELDLWECYNCGERTMTHHPHPDAEDD